MTGMSSWSRRTSILLERTGPMLFGSVFHAYEGNGGGADRGERALWRWKHRTLMSRRYLNALATPAQRQEGNGQQVAPAPRRCLAQTWQGDLAQVRNRVAS